MNRVWKFFQSRWRRPKHKGVSGNFSTIVIITGIVFAGWIMTGGEYPNVYPTYTSTPMQGEPLADQPEHPKRFSLTFHELRFKNRPAAPPADSLASCDKVALVFLVDASTSMTERGPNGITKLDNVKNALYEFTDDLSSTSLFGLYTFSSPNGGEPRSRVSIGLMPSIQFQIDSAISGINPPENAATYMREGFESVRGPLVSAKQQYPDYKFNLIFISDGVPEHQAPCEDQYTLTGTCDNSGANNSRNYDIRHDPIDTSLGNSNVVQQIKDSGVSIYSIVLSNATDAQVFPELRSLMQRIASSDSQYKESVGGENINAIYQEIKTSACS